MSRKAPVSRTPKTPSLPPRLISCDTPSTPIQQARTQLHVSVKPDTLPCREDEFTDIYYFVQSKIYDRTGGCMYISGVPGTGKTATANQVIILSYTLLNIVILLGVMLIIANF